MADHTLNIPPPEGRREAQLMDHCLERAERAYWNGAVDVAEWFVNEFLPEVWNDSWPVILESLESRGAPDAILAAVKGICDAEGGT